MRIDNISKHTIGNTTSSSPEQLEDGSNTPNGRKVSSASEQPKHGGTIPGNNTAASSPRHKEDKNGSSESTSTYKKVSKSSERVKKVFVPDYTTVKGRIRSAWFTVVDRLWPYTKFWAVIWWRKWVKRARCPDNEPGVKRLYFVRWLLLFYRWWADRLFNTSLYGLDDFSAPGIRQLLPRFYYAFFLLALPVGLVYQLLCYLWGYIFTKFFAKVLFTRWLLPKQVVTSYHYYLGYGRRYNIYGTPEPRWFHQRGSANLALTSSDSLSGVMLEPYVGVVFILVNFVVLCVVIKWMKHGFISRRWWYYLWVCWAIQVSTYWFMWDYWWHTLCKFLFLVSCQRQYVDVGFIFIIFFTTCFLIGVSHSAEPVSYRSNLLFTIGVFLVSIISLYLAYSLWHAHNLIWPCFASLYDSIVGVIQTIIEYNKTVPGPEISPNLGVETQGVGGSQNTTLNNNTQTAVTGTTPSTVGNKQAEPFSRVPKDMNLGRRRVFYARTLNNGFIANLGPQYAKY